ncbi:hypothetical protein [uncultured Victivallis sp.]|uniref:hypothetical protein n=1 Tax=uncultured Victivallis sp. TaxID=354118 RepID=UPI00258D1F8C|nr:hypothetical protein [uncultured Victivallis sp.]
MALKDFIERLSFCLCSCVRSPPVYAYCQFGFPILYLSRVALLTNDNKWLANALFDRKIIEMEQINYAKLDKRQKEIFNKQHLMAVLADYGYHCIGLSADWNGADFLAQHFKTNETLFVQLKAGLTIAEKYKNKSLHIAFPLAYDGRWVLIPHDILWKTIDQHAPQYLQTSTWKLKGQYYTDRPNKTIRQLLSGYILEPS